jgi:hypothetical protein
VERRKEPRQPADELVWLTVLEESAAPTPVLAVERSGRGMRVIAMRPLRPGAAIKLEPEDSLMLGEVCYCQPCDAGFMVGLRLSQELKNLKLLDRLNDALFASAPKRAAAAASATMMD